MAIKKLKKDILFAILSGLLIGTSYIPLPPWALFFCLTPLWFTWLKETSKKRIFFTGWIAQFLLVIIGFHWVPHTIVEFGHMPSIIGLLGLFAFAAFSCLHIPLAGVFWKWICNKYAEKKPLDLFSSLVLLAFLTYLLERVNPQIFPWNFGYPWLWGNMPGFQIADVIGFEGLSFVSFLINAWVLFIILNLKNKKMLHLHVASLILFFAAINFWGLQKEKTWNNFDSSANFLITQANIGNLDKQFEIYGQQFKEPTINKFITLTQNKIDELKNAKENQPAKKIDYILWPETAIPEYMDDVWVGRSVRQKVIEFIKKNQIALIGGGYSKNMRARGESNGVFFFDHDGTLKGTYKKSILLAFGEYIPGGHLFPFLLKLIPEIADFERGQGPTSIELQNINMGPQICYEGLHPWFVAGNVSQGADVLVNVTNDSWFGHGFESYQHLYMTLARAIEFRRPLIRATNTGISSAILANGSVIEFSPRQVEWTGLVTLSFKKNAPTTFYNQIYLFMPFVLLIFSLLFATVFNFLTKKAATRG